MSRIFDALQRSGTEQSGVEYPDLVSVVTEVFEAPRQQAPAVAPAPEPPTQPGYTIESPEAGTVQFPSMRINLAAAGQLVILTEPDSLAAEKFRFLGVRLRQLQQSRTLKRVLVTSTIAEEGKSLVSANLAGALARRKHKVLLIEGDLRRPVHAERFGLGSVAGLGEWLQGESKVITNIYRLEGPGFWFMPAGDLPTNPLELMQSGKLSELMGHLATMFDWIIVDSPPLLPLADTTVWARVTDGALLVAREGKTEKAQLQRGLEILKKSDLLGVVLNGCTNPSHKNYYQRYSPGTK